MAVSFGVLTRRLCNTDPWERQDIAAANPTIVNKMSARLALLMKGVFEGHGPAGANQSAVCAATARNLGYLTPGDYEGPLPHTKASQADAAPDGAAIM